MGERRDIYRVLVGKPEGKRTLERLRRRWEDNIKMDLHEVDVGAWTGSIRFSIGTGGGHLCMR
jgi:hypothetical protein